MVIISYFKQFFRYFNDERKPFVIYSVFSLIAGILELFGVALIYPFILKILSKNSMHDSMNSTIILGILIIVLFLLKNVFMIFYTKFQTEYTSKFEAKIKIRLMEFFIRNDYQAMSKISLAEKIKMLELLTKNVMDNFIFRLLSLNVNLFIFLLITYFLVIKFPVATLSAFFAGIILLVFQTYIYRPYLTRLAKKISDSGLMFNQAANEVLINLKAVKISNNEKYFYEKYANSTVQYYDGLKKTRFFNMVPPYVVEPFSIILLFIIIAVIFYQNYVEPDKLIASLALVGAAIFRLTPAISRIQVNLNGINSALPMVKEFIDNFEKLKTDSDNKIGQKEFVSFNDCLEIKNLCFSYDNYNMILNHLNLKILKGEFIGITGVSGSGKTTLVDIIAGLYKPVSGQILVDGHSLDKPLRIGYVPQDFVLIKGSFRENVAFGNDCINDNMVIEVLKKAQLYDYIISNYSEGIYASPFVDSIGLSQGQKQRLAIARAMYSNPDILIMDEATSALDYKTEEEICSVLKTLKGKTTIIAIAHRLSMLGSADKIVVISDGKVMSDKSKNGGELK